MTSQIQPVVAITGNSFILLAVMIVMVFAISYGLFTRQGSGINKHPQGDSQDPVVSEGDGEGDLDDDRGDERAGVDRTETVEMDQHGTQ